MDGQLLPISILRTAYCGVSPPASVSMRPEDMVECQRSWQEKRIIVDGANCTENVIRICCGSWSFQATILYLEYPNARKLKMTHYLVE